MHPSRAARIVLATCISLAVLTAAGGSVVIWAGLYDVAATRQHSRPVFRLVELALQRSIERHARSIVVPDLTHPALVGQGMALFREHCAPCHGEPGLAPRALAMGMTPIPPSMVALVRDRPPQHLFWIVKNGIKMTGMPSWGTKLDDAQIWSIVSFLQHLPLIAPSAYLSALKDPDPAQSLLNYLADPASQIGVLGKLPAARQDLPAQDAIAALDGDRDSGSSEAVRPSSIQLRPPLALPRPAIAPCATAIAGCEERGRPPPSFGDAQRGRLALREFACTSCHEIDGIVGRAVRVGPPLPRVTGQGFIAGILPRTPSNFVKWIRNPQQLKPASAMPDMGVGEQAARDMTAYFYRD